LSTKETTRIAPADGKLGILIPGIGAVSTTFMAGVEAVKRGLGEPIGSLTQLGTVRLGKRTDARTPRIQDFVPLATIAPTVNPKAALRPTITNTIPQASSSDEAARLTTPMGVDA